MCAHHTNPTETGSNEGHSKAAARAITAPTSPARRALAAVAWVGLIIACVSAIVFLLPARLASLPVDVLKLVTDLGGTEVLVEIPVGE